jgi:hypothetical protein
MSQQPIIEQAVFVVRIYEDRTIVGPERWFYTVSKDAVRFQTSGKMTEQAVMAIVEEMWK